MTADVPPGPARRAGEGIVTLARLSGRPIVPFAVATSRFIAFPTWSRMTLNLPFSKMAYVHRRPDLGSGRADAGGGRGLQGSGRGRSQSRDEPRLCARGRKHQARDAAQCATTGPLPPVGFALKAYRGVTSLFGAVAPLFLSLRARQGKEDPAASVSGIGEASVAAARGSARLVPCGERRRDQRHSAADRAPHQHAARPSRSADDGHGHVGCARVAPARRPGHPSVRAARCSGLREAVFRPLAAGSRRVHRIRDLAQSHHRSGGAEGSRRARQRAHVRTQS